MISASSSLTLKAARKLIAEPLLCYERHRTWASLSQQQRRYSTEGQPSVQQRRRPPRPILGSKTNRSLSNPKTETKTPGKNPKGPNVPLAPYSLSRRLIRLASQNKLDEAIVMLQNAPSDASNVKTWNTILLHCMVEERFQLGAKLFADMKRRGFVPNTRTYNVLLGGLSRIKQWENYTLQFKNAQTLWRSFLGYIEHLKKVNPQDQGIDPNPAAFYITILAANKEYNTMFDVLNDLDQAGQFSPTEFIYTRLFQAIAYRSQLTPGDEEKLSYRNASDAKLVWKDLIKRAVNNPELVSHRIIMYLLKALMKGRPADQLYAFDLVRDFFGLSKPGEEAPPRQIPLTPMTLDAVLLLCLVTQKYRLCVHYAQQLMDEATVDGGKCIIDHGHMVRVLQSYAAMTIAGSAGESNRAVKTIEWMLSSHALGLDVKPQASTYGWGLMACWRGGDWASAARIAELMTGCHAQDFVDGSPNSPSPRLDGRSEGGTILPDVRDVSCLLRAASASGEVANMKQCLRMVTFFGDLRSSSNTNSMDVYLAWPSRDATVTEKAGSFYYTKVASALAQVLEQVLEGTDPVADTPELKAWRGLRARAKKILRESAKAEVKTPSSELQPLGSAEGLEATERLVDYDLATRSQKSSRTTR